MYKNMLNDSIPRTLYVYLFYNTLFYTHEIQNYALYFLFQVIFFTVLFMYSAFVLRSIDTEYYIQGPARIFEYSVYIWAFGDLLEEILSLSVS